MIAFACGAGYAGALWSLAAADARRRALRLGGVPILTLIASALSAAALERLYAPTGFALIATSLIGTFVCATVDARTGLIFNVLCATMSVVAVILAVREGRLIDGLLGATVTGGLMLALYVGTARRGIGLGDVKLTAALGLGYGLPLSLLAIGAAFIVGALYGITLLATGRATRGDAVRFGPFIAIGAAAGVAANLLGYHL